MTTTNGATTAELQALEALAKAQADAAKARSDQLAAEVAAEKAQLERDEYASASARRKRRAESEKSATEARKAAREESESNSPAARLQRQAEQQQKIAEAGKAAAEARRAQVAALIPDLSKVEPGSLAVSGDKPLFATALAERALGEAAGRIAAASIEQLPEDREWRLLVTSNAELADADAAYHDVVTGLDQLRIAADTLIAQAAAPGVTGASLGGLDVLGALATAVPGVLSLLSAKRAVTTSDVEVTDLAASAAVAGALKARAPHRFVMHDSVRLLRHGAVHAKVTAVGERRQKLTAQRIVLAKEKAQADGNAKLLQKQVDALWEALAEAASEQDKLELTGEAQDKERALAAEEETVADAAARIALLDTVLAAIDGFMAELTTVPQGAARSPLAAAALHQALHDDDTETAISHVLLVRSEAGSAQQVVGDQPLWWKDHFAVVAAVSATYVLIEVPGSAVLAAGVEGATAEVRARSERTSS